MPRCCPDHWACFMSSLVISSCCLFPLPRLIYNLSHCPRLSQFCAGLAHAMWHLVDIIHTKKSRNGLIVKRPKIQICPGYPSRPENTPATTPVANAMLLPYPSLSFIQTRVRIGCSQYWATLMNASRIVMVIPNSGHALTTPATVTSLVDGRERI